MVKKRASESSSPIDLSTFEKAIASLEAALTPPPVNDRERDGAIQRFEYTFELAWKTLKRFLDREGFSLTSPRTVLREASNQGWITDIIAWFEFLDARNASTHTYVEKTANEVFRAAERFAVACRNLIEHLRKIG